MKQFSEQLKDFTVALDKMAADYTARHHPSLANTSAQPRHTTMTGKKYIRVVREDSSQRCVYCFLDMKGNIYKADGWKGPAKGIRGSIYDDNFSFGAGLTYFGAAYTR